MNRTRWLVVLLAIGASALIGMFVAGGPSGLSREKAIEWTPPAMTSTPRPTAFASISSDIIIPTIIAPTRVAAPIASPTPNTPIAQGTPEAATPNSSTPIASPMSASPAATPAATPAPTDGTSID